MSIQIANLASNLLSRLHARPLHQRYLLGITGIPAAGKSTFAELLVSAINEDASQNIAITVSMDGFHLRDEVLEAHGLRPMKGEPSTFDAQGFIDLLKKLRDISSLPINCPTYDRTLHAPIENALKVQPHHLIAVIEGNYLLLDDSPWNKVNSLLDEIWFIATSQTVAFDRLMARHMAGGMTEEEAKIKIERTDIPNAHLIEQTRNKADRIIEIETIEELKAKASYSN